MLFRSYERIVIFLEHLDAVGGGLKKAVESYNKSIASLQSRLLPLAERFEGLGVATQKELPELEQITEEPRIAVQPTLPGVGACGEDDEPQALSAAGE